MNNWYKVSATDITGMGESEYVATVKLYEIDTSPNGDWDVVINETVSFKYNIEMEHRSWGIKGINVYFRSIVNVNALITYFDDKGNETKTETKVIAIDTSKMPIEYVKGDGIYVTDMDINLTANLEVDYKMSSITVAK